MTNNLWTPAILHYAGAFALCLLLNVALAHFAAAQTPAEDILRDMRRSLQHRMDSLGGHHSPPRAVEPAPRPHHDSDFNHRHEDSRGGHPERGERRRRGRGAQDLFCKAGVNNSAIPTRASDGQELGAYYFSSIENCEQALGSARFGIVCTAHVNNSAIPTRISDGQTLGPYYFSTNQACFRATAAATPQLVCVSGVNGQSAILNHHSGQVLDAYFRQNLEACLRSVSR